MAALPYMPFYIADFKADTAHLNFTQRAAYLELIQSYWQTGKPLNNKDDRLAVVIGIEKNLFVEIKDLLSEFFIVENDIWTHGRVEAELEKVHAKSTKAAYAGAQSAKKRANQRLEESNERSTSVEQVFNHTDTDTDTDKRKELVQISFERFWEIYPRKQGKAKAKIAFEKALKSNDVELIIEAATRYAKDSNRVDEFTAMPATWLTGERWNDAALPQRSLPKSGGFVVTSPTPTPPRFKASEVTQGVEMPENLRQIALRRAN